MAERSHRIRPLDIREEIAGILALTQGVTFDTFAGSWAMKRAVQHALLIIAEAAKHIPSQEKDSQPSVPWRQIHGLGNMLRHEYRRHEYRRIDPAILWSVVVEHLAPLDAVVVVLLARLPE